MTNNGAGEDDTAAFASKLAPEADVVSPKAPKDAEKSVKAGAVSLAEPVEENTDGSAGSGAASSNLSLIHISEPTRPRFGSRMPSSA